MNVIVFLMFVASVYCIPCKNPDPEASGTRRSEGFHYYYKTTTATGAISSNNRDPVTLRTITPRRKMCAPYEFNEDMCEYVDDRELCGYNKNPEKVASGVKSRPLSNGCRLRKGRLECGYQQPYDNVRRPPV